MTIIQHASNSEHSNNNHNEYTFQPTTTTAKLEIHELPMTVPTICIPHVHHSLTIQDIQDAFQRFDIGTVTYVRMLDRESYSCVFVHIVWNETDKAIKIRKRLLKGKSIKFLYGEDLEETPWFWKCVAVKSHLQMVKQ